MTPLTSLRLRAILLLTILFIFASHANAQANQQNPPAANQPAANQPAANAPAPANGQDNQPNQQTADATQNQNTITRDGGATATPTGDAANTDSANTAATETSPTVAATPSSSTSSSSAPAPAAATPTADNGAAPIFTNAPSLQGVGIPPLIVPDTSGAPFMQKETVPEGTVFIAVGAILAFIGTTILAWRGLVAWSLHRSVKHAANHQYPTDAKPLFGGSARGGYTSMYADSNVSLEHLAATNTAYNNGSGTAAARYSNQGKKSKSSRRPESTQPSSSLFFSPTAGAASQSSATRTSSYLPAGFYASGSAAPAAGTGVAHVGGGGRASSYNQLNSAATSPPQSPIYQQNPTARHASQPNTTYSSRPVSRDVLDYPRGRQQPTGRGSQPGSAYTSRPASRDRLDNPRVRRSHNQGASETTMSLGAPPQGRAPSAYLDDLFENHGNGPRERF